MKKQLSSIVLTACMVASSFAQSTYTDKDLVWVEDFNGKKVNTKDWNFEFHEPGWVNNELQSYGNSSKNTYIKDGCLVIQPLMTENADGTINYTSGRINTMGKHSFTYGRFETRLKVPKGQGYLPAFWMMPEDESFYGQWPKCGEIDIMEVLGQQTDTLYGTLHYGEPHKQSQGIYKIDSSNFADEFHVFACEWEPGEMRFYCDDVLYKTMNNWFTKKPGFGEVTYPAPFDQPFYLILNVAVGGSWPGYPDDTTTFDEKAQMVVDYVKVYQKKSYNENVEKPLVTLTEEATDTTGNMVRTGSAEWQYLQASTGAGKADVKGGDITVTTEDEGTLEYSVQLVQSKLALAQGYSYKYSFDAWADADRTMITGITAPDNGFIRYFGDKKVNLTKNKQHYEFDFDMREDSDANSRIEYNLGAQGSKAGVHITNVRLEKTGVAKVAKGDGILPDGNYIQNGQFQEGKNRLAAWEFVNNCDAKAYVTNENKQRALKVEIPKNVKTTDAFVVKQSGLKIKAGTECVLRFDAVSTKTAKVVVKLGDMVQTPRILTIPGHFEYAFKAPEGSENGIDLEIELGNAGSVITIDNVSVKENSLVLNGNFEREMSGWEVYAHQNAHVSYEVVPEKERNAMAITIDDSGNLDWMIQLKQNNVMLEKGKKYKVTFNAKSDIDRSIMWALQRDGAKDDNWFPYSDTNKMKIGSEWQSFTKTFNMARDTDEHVIFTISMGAVNDKRITQKHTVWIDNINCEQVD